MDRREHRIPLGPRTDRRAHRALRAPDPPGGPRRDWAQHDAARVGRGHRGGGLRPPLPRRRDAGRGLRDPGLLVPGRAPRALRAVVLTHGHEDHIGALSYLLRDFDVPVYGTPLTLAIARHRLAEHGLLDRVDLRDYKPGDEIVAGCFRVVPMRVTHSIADGIGLAIETPAGLVVHTGDFKLD